MAKWASSYSKSIMVPHQLENFNGHPSKSVRSFVLLILSAHVYMSESTRVSKPIRRVCHKRKDINLRNLSLCPSTRASIFMKTHSITLLSIRSSSKVISDFSNYLRCRKWRRFPVAISGRQFKRYLFWIQISSIFWIVRQFTKTNGRILTGFSL